MRPVVRGLCALATLASVYVALLYVLDSAHFGALLLSAGAHTPVWALASGALLVLARVALVVGGPGVVFAAAGWALGRVLPRLARVTRTPARS